ncbi:phosphotransferase [Streptomyces tendae]|uniref:phosphotransferase n=1 Tax=Streptomyces tendae TaxID=1932 RepID=UPI0033DFADCE
MGSFVSGDTVRRPTSARAKVAGDLLRLLEASGWSCGPRYFGVDDEGREVLSYLDGHVAWEPQQPAAVSSDERLVRVARLTWVPRPDGWHPAGRRPRGRMSHTDLSPKNTVYRMHRGELRPTAFIDWDLAAPGARILDIAHVCWRYLDPDPAVNPDEEVGQRVRLIVDSYEWSGRSESRECTMGELARPLCPDAPSLRCVAACQGHENRRGTHGRRASVAVGRDSVARASRTGLRRDGGTDDAAPTDSGCVIVEPCDAAQSRPAGDCGRDSQCGPGIPEGFRELWWRYVVAGSVPCVRTAG